MPPIVVDHDDVRRQTTHACELTTQVTRAGRFPYFLTKRTEAGNEAFPAASTARRPMKGSLVVTVAHCEVPAAAGVGRPASGVPPAEFSGVSAFEEARAS